MTSNPGMNMNSVLPLNARTMRIAAGGGVFAYAHAFPACGNAAVSGRVSGAEPDASARSADDVYPFEQNPNTTIHHN